MNPSASSGQAGAGQAVRDAMTAALRARVELAGIMLTDGGATSSVLPRIEIAEPQSADWSAKDFRGRELRTVVTVRVSDGQRGRMAAVTEAIERAGESLTGAIGGWRVVGTLFLRTRGANERGGHAVLIEHRIRVMKVN